MKQIDNMEARIERIEEVLASAAGGDFQAQLEIAEGHSDLLTSVETGINLLIADLGEEVRQSRRRAEELENRLDLIESQDRAIEELSTPVIKIWEKVLALPLIGTLDSKRSQSLTEKLLQEIASSGNKVTIIDITGVSAVDSAVASHLLKTVGAVRLLGAECIITGIQPEVAQTIVHLGVDIGQVETLSNLSEGLKWAFRRLDLMIYEKRSME